jgi:apoptosis-inducing factor 2
VKARVSALHKGHVVLDRDWQGQREIPFDYLVVASGTKLRAPGTMTDDEKPPSIKYLQRYQARLRQANSIAIIGGGAVGVQMATDLKEVYPDKDITLIHSRNQLMPLYHEKLDEIIKARCRELGVK